MFTPEELRELTFNRGMRGYNPEEVDAFLEEISREMASVLKERDETEEKLFVLAEKIEEYRAEEEMVKTTLINAQRLGESVIHEAKVKADVILRDAKAQSERITEAAESSIQKEQLVLSRLKSEVSNFKNEILTLYKEHINLLSDLTSEKPMKEEPITKEQSIEDILLDTAAINTQPLPAEIDAVPESEINFTSGDPFGYLDAETENLENSTEDDDFEL